MAVVLALLKSSRSRRVYKIIGALAIAICPGGLVALSLYGAYAAYRARRSRGTPETHH